MSNKILKPQAESYLIWFFQKFGMCWNRWHIWHMCKSRNKLHYKQDFCWPALLKLNVIKYLYRIEHVFYLPTSLSLSVLDLRPSLPVFSHFSLMFFLLLCLILSCFFSQRCTQWTRCRRIKSSAALTNLQFILQGYFGSGCNALSLHPGLCQSHFPIIAPAHYLCNVSKIQTNTCNDKWSPPSLTIKRISKWVTQSNRNIFVSKIISLYCRHARYNQRTTFHLVDGIPFGIWIFFVSYPHDCVVLWKD